MQWNSRSIKSKFGEFAEVVTNSRPHIVAIQESYLKEKDKLPNMENYNIHRRDRPGERGGGILFYARKDLQYYTKNLTNYQGGILETQCITIKLKRYEMDILNIYNHVDTLNINEFNHYFRQLKSKFLIIGDFNGHHPLWEPSKRHNINSINGCGRALHELLIEMINLSLATPPDLPTYINPHSGKQSTIDLQFCPPRCCP